MLALFDQSGAKDVPIVLKTACGSIASAIWRVGLMPYVSLPSPHARFNTIAPPNPPLSLALPMHTPYVCRLDTLMTCKQVAGREGWTMLSRKFRRGGPQVLFHGAGASFAANVVGHYPWCVYRR